MHLLLWALLIASPPAGESDRAPSVVDEAGKVLFTPVALRSEGFTDPAVLQRKVSIDVREMPMDQLLAEMAREHDFNLVIDAHAFDVVQADPHKPVTLRLENVPLGSALSYILHPLELTAQVRHEAVHIVDEPVTGQALVTRFHTVADLPVSQSPADFPFEELVELMMNVLAPELWEEFGGESTLDYCPFSMSLVITAPRYLQDLVHAYWMMSRAQRDKSAKLLQVLGREPVHELQAQLLAARSDGPRRTNPPQQPQFVGISTDVSHKRTTANSRVDLDARQIPLKEALTRLESISGRRFVLDDLGTDIDMSQRVFVRLRNVSLQSALYGLLTPVKMGYEESADGAIIIRAASSEGERLQTRSYPVGDLTPLTHADLVTIPRKLMHLIQDAVQPDSWERNGGEGELRYFANQQILAVRQHPLVHKHLQEFLDSLRDARSRVSVIREAAKRASMQAAASQPTRPANAGSLSPVDRQALADLVAPVYVERHIRSLFEFLDIPVTVHVEKVSLQQLVTELRRQTQVNILLDQDGLAHAKIDPSQEVSARLGSTTLGQCMRTVLRPLGLCAVVVDDVVMITDEQEVAQELAVRLYPIADLLPPKRPQEVLEDIVDALIDDVEPDFWDANGGLGVIEFDIHSLSLVVSQQLWVHDLVEQRINKLRRSAGLPTYRPNR